MAPSARQWAPPELLATLPPMVHADCDEGSGADEAKRLSFLTQVEIDDPGSDPCGSVLHVDFDFIHRRWWTGRFPRRRV